VGKVVGDHNKEERKNRERREGLWRGLYVQNLVIGKGGTHKPRIF